MLTLVRTTSMQNRQFNILKLLIKYTDKQDMLHTQPRDFEILLEHANMM